VNVLHLFPQLCAVRCELRNDRTGVSNLDLSPLSENKKLRSVALTGCSEGLDLSPLLQLPALESLELVALRRPPDLAALADVGREWTLTLACPACGDRLDALTALQGLTWLHLRGCDEHTDLRALPPPPRSLRGLSLYGFPRLASLNGIEQCDSVQTIELFECPQITDLTPLAAVKSLEHISLGIFSEEPMALSPLTSLPRLKQLSLKGHGAFDVSFLAGIQDLVITVPPRARIVGADRLGPTSRVEEFEYEDIEF
jgi:hypothetical protein